MEVATPTVQRFTPTRTHTWTVVPDSQELEQLSGQRLAESRVQLTVGLGSVTPATKTPPAGFQDLSGACQVDAEHDAFLPMRVTLLNHGPVALDTTVAFAISDVRNSAGLTSDPIPVEAATTFSTDPPLCQPIGNTGQSTTLEFASLAPGRPLEHNYLLMLPTFYSPNYDSRGDLPALRHMVGYITALQVYVTGDSPSHSLTLDAVSCYSGPPRQAVDGPGAPARGLHVAEAIGPPPAGVSPILPDFTLAERGFDYAYEPGGATITEPSGYDAC